MERSMLRIASLNVNNGIHFGLRNYLLYDWTTLDVLCLQEIHPDHVKTFEQMSGMHRVSYYPMGHDDKQGDEFGMTVLVHPRIARVGDWERLDNAWRVSDVQLLPYHYHGHEHIKDRLPLLHEGELPHRALQVFTVHAGEDLQWTIAHTHFTWTPRSVTNMQQILDMPRMLRQLNNFERIILIGDLNMPRGVNPLWQRLVMHGFVDRVPAIVASTIDRANHRYFGRKGIQGDYLYEGVVVDGVFTKGHEQTQVDVHVRDGFSDHCLLEASVQGARRQS